MQFVFIVNDLHNNSLKPSPNGSFMVLTDCDALVMHAHAHSIRLRRVAQVLFTLCETRPRLVCALLACMRASVYIIGVFVWRLSVHVCVFVNVCLRVNPNECGPVYCFYSGAN